MLNIQFGKWNCTTLLVHASCGGILGINKIRQPVNIYLCWPFMQKITNATVYTKFHNVCYLLIQNNEKDSWIILQFKQFLKLFLRPIYLFAYTWRILVWCCFTLEMSNISKLLFKFLSFMVNCQIARELSVYNSI